MTTIIVTGASSGIGRACAEHFLTHGWHVGLIARRDGPLNEIAQGNDNAVVLPCDVTQEHAVQAAFADFGQIDVLFNNAGMFGPQTTIDQISLADWQQVVDVNLTGMFLCAREAFKAMRAQDPQGGRIINNGSISAHVPRDGSTCYTTTKHAITGLTKTLSLDGRPNARTEMVADLEARRAVEGLPPLDTMDVAHVAQAVYHTAMLPLSANVQFQTIMATKMPYIGRG